MIFISTMKKQLTPSIYKYLSQILFDITRDITRDIQGNRVIFFKYYFDLYIKILHSNYF